MDGRSPFILYIIVYPPQTRHLGQMRAQRESLTNTCPTLMFLVFTSSGCFKQNTATVNNRVKNYDISKFTRRNKLSKQEYSNGEGGWNPKGTNNWRLAECKVTK